MPDPGPDTTVLAAFAVGFASFVSPCVLPLVPGYLSAISGVTITELEEGSGKKARVLLPAVIFCLSFTVVFVALGMTATGLGSALQENRATLDRVSGILIIVLGAFFILAPLVPKLNREWHPQKLMIHAASGGPLVAGAAFAIAWTPCVGPTLGSILAAAATQQSAGEGGILLAFYSAGLAVPFLLSAVAFNRATRTFRWLRDHYTIITVISGAILIAMGILIATGEMTRLNAEAQRLLSELNLDFIYSL